MLKGLSPLLNADVLYVLKSMGHGDYIVLSDLNFRLNRWRSRRSMAAC